MRYPFFVVLVAGLLLGSGCQNRHEPSPAEAQALEPARAAVRHGDLDRALALYREQAAAGSRFARLELADLLAGRGGTGDLEAAAREIEAAALDGSPVAALRYARLLEQGRGVPVDPAAAIGWYRLAAADGMAEAETALGRLARDGVGMKADATVARRHFRRAAEAGDPDAGLALARMLGAAADGDGPAEARRLVAAAIADLERSAPQQPGAAERLADLYLEGELVRSDTEVAARWLLVAAEGGSTAARVRLARLLQNGRGDLAPDPVRAARHFEIASDEGDAAARYELARLHLDGEGVARDPVRALRLMQSAAAAGEVKALRALGDLYADGAVVPRDAAEAARWYEAAAAEGDGAAAVALARLYDQGAGLEPDPILALMWYRVAHAAGAEPGRARARALAADLDPGEVQRAAILADDWQRRTGATAPIQAGLR